MKTNCVITIGRQFGSGGRYVGRMLAEKLGIPFYDKELLSEAAKQSGICEEIFEDHDEKPTRSLLFNLVTGMQVHGDAGSYYMDMPLNHKIFLAQFDAIRSIADKGPCVIVGRCADYVLKDRPNTISVFLKAEMQSKVERAVKYYGVDPQKAEDRIRKADKQRASYYNYYATATWGDVNNYDLCVDTGKLGVEGTAELIARNVPLPVINIEISGYDYLRAIKLAEGDEVVGVCICRENATILTVTENGKGRRSDIDTYRITARGGKGIRNYDASKDKVAAVKIVDDVDDVLLSSQEGIIIRLHANEIPVQSRYGSGVRVMRLGENDKVMVLARTDHDDEAQTETVEAEEGDEPTAEQLAAMEAADEASASEAPSED